MKPEFKQPWIDALRSGKFKQAHREFVARNGAKCCLAVLCAVAGFNPVCDADAVDGEEWFRLEDALSRGGREYFGLTTNNHYILIKMNDAKRATFAQIADWIEANL